MTIGIAVLGSTGSIGKSTLRVIARMPQRFRAVALTAYGAAELLCQQARETRAEFLGLVNGGSARAGDAGIARGPSCLVDAATYPGVDIVVNAVVGAAGLPATLAALAAGKRVALANKETLVMAGDLVRHAATAGGGEIVPIDSEHSGVLQCLSGRSSATVRRLILTASGGPFRDWSADRLRNVTVQDALNHPTWRMGRKITVDSASLANKALEVIEAHHLFGLGYDQIDVVVHPQSVVHAFTEFVDGSILAQMGLPNMELPILYALTHPDRWPDPSIPPFDPVAIGALTFEPVRRADFPAFALGVQAGRTGGTAPAAFSAANEVAVQAFLQGRITFGRIAAVLDSVLNQHATAPADSVETVLAADRDARDVAEALCS